MGRILRAVGTRALLVCAVTALGAFVAAGCGSSSDSGGSGATATASGSSKADTASAKELAAVRQMVKDASSGAVLGPGAGSVHLPVEALTPERGAASITPFPFKPGGTPKSVVVLSCGPTATCVHSSALMVGIVQKLGWKGATVQAQEVAPAPQQAAFNTALGTKPDAVIAIGIAAAVVGPQLARAKKQGVYTVLTNGTELGGKGYDAYLGGGYSLSASVLAAKMIDEGQGKTSIFYAQVPEIPYLGIIEGTEFVKQYCPDCDLIQQDVPVQTLVQPVPMGQFATSMIRKHPKLDYFANPSTDVQVQAASQSFRSAASKAKVVASNLNGPTAMAGLTSGDLPFIAGVPQEWSALQAVDAVLRGLAGKPALPAEESKIGVYLMTKENAPDNPKNLDGPVDRWAVEQFDFVAPYSKAWNVDLSSIAAQAK
jgi:ABC-type sugar transport system substrate-binding protein